VTHELMQRVSPHTGWHQRLAQLLKDHPFADPAAMGFLPTWQNETFWKLNGADISI